MRESGIGSLAVPALGCGHGGLPWQAVRPLLDGVLGGMDGRDATVYVPHGLPDTV